MHPTSHTQMRMPPSSRPPPALIPPSSRPPVARAHMPRAAPLCSVWHWLTHAMASHRGGALLLALAFATLAGAPLRGLFLGGHRHCGACCAAQAAAERQQAEPRGPTRHAGARQVHESGERPDETAGAVAAVHSAPKCHRRVAPGAVARRVLRDDSHVPARAFVRGPFAQGPGAHLRGRCSGAPLPPVPAAKLKRVASHPPAAKLLLSAERAPDSSSIAIYLLTYLLDRRMSSSS